MRKELIAGTEIAIDFLLRLGLVTMVVVMYMGGLVAFGSIGFPEKNPHIVLQTCMQLSVFAFFFVFMFIATRGKIVRKLFKGGIFE